MSLFVSILLASFAESLVSFAGAFLAIFSADRMKKIAHFIVSFAVGALLSVAILEVIPEAIAMSSAERVLPFVLAGIILFFVLEKFLFWYHCHGGICPVHTYTHLILWGDFLHNFIDGVMIALAFLADPKLGVLATIAVIAHEIPQEIGDFALLIHGGFSKSRAMMYNFLVSLATIVGAVLTYMFGDVFGPFLPAALGVVAGNFVYLATSDLMPELHESTRPLHSVIQIILILFGIFLVLLPERLFGL